MCGIFGWYAKKGSAGLEPGRLEALTGLMVHRGPDDEGYYHDGPIALGHRRLSIIDLAGGRQPIQSPDGSLVIVFNGEIYNYRELRAELIAKGHRFRTQSDTEVILYAYREYGPDCVRKLRGIFAFGIYDKIRRSFFAARDPLGVKPLYYYEDGDRLVVSSEIRPILRSGCVRPRLHTGMLDFFFTLGFTPAPETLFDGIRKLPPAHRLEATPETTTITEYWSLDPIEENRIPFETAKERLRERLLEAVESQLISEVPLGAFLSGGLDSSAVAACMRRLGVKDLRTFSIGYRDAEAESELKFARRVADHLRTDHHEFYFEPADFLQSLDLMLDYTEEPLVDSAAIALLQLARRTKPHATVLLSGEGGDELFGGYPLYPRMKVLRAAGKAIRFIPGGETLRRSVRKRLPEKAVKYLDWAAEAGRRPSGWYGSIAATVTEGIRERMYRPEFYEAVADGTGPDDYFGNLMARVGHRGPAYRMQYVDTKTCLVDGLLLKADKMTMAASLELRVPLLDVPLLEFTATLPDAYKLHGREGKYILKKLMEEYLPHEIVYRTKQGFPVPTRQWFQDRLYEPIRRILLDPEGILRSTIRTDYLDRVLSEHRQGRADHSTRILSLLTLELWKRRYLGDGDANR
jgi:asparagine synthase (glutamine-hydrolysing)